MVKRILELDYHCLPKHIKNKLNLDKSKPRNEYWSEFVGSERESWADLNRKGLTEFHRKKKIADDFDGTFEEMVEDYDLILDLWLVEKRINLIGIDVIVIVV